MKSELVYILPAAVLLLIAAAVCAYARVMHPGIMRCGNGPIRVSCVGDSITYGLGVLPRRRSRSYPAYLAALLGEAYSVCNYGLTNRTLLPRGGCHYFSDRVGRAALADAADIVIFMLGSNDSKAVIWDAAEFEREYRAALDRFKASPRLRQLLVMIPPRIFTPKPGQRGCCDAVVRDEAAPIIRRVAAEYGAALVDLYALTEDHPDWFPDKLHPNAAGNLAIAREIAGHIAARKDPSEALRTEEMI